MAAIAKTGPDGTTRSVVGHCLDVAHCAHAMLTLALPCRASRRSQAFR